METRMGIEMDEEFKCEICGKHPAKKVWYNSKNEEKYICQTCYEILSCGITTRFLYFIYKRMEAYEKSMGDSLSTRERELMNSRKMVLRAAMFFISIPDRNNFQFDGEWYSVHHPYIPGVKCLMRWEDASSWETSIIAAVETGTGKRLDFRIRFMDSEPEPGAAPIVDEKMAEFMSDPSIGFEVPVRWMRILPLEEYGMDNMDRFFFLFNQGWFNPWADDERWRNLCSEGEPR